MIWSSEHGENFIFNRLTGKGCGRHNNGLQVEVTALSGTEPLTLEEVKGYCNIDYDDWDVLIQTILIPGARQRAEKYMNRSLRPQTLKVSWARTSGYVELPYSPVNGITSVENKDGETLSYETNHQGLIDIPSGAIVTYEAGTWPLGIPLDVKVGLLKQISSWFEYRENVIVGYSLNEIPEDSKQLYQLHSKNLWL